jgi:hypothetical protein
LATNNIPLWLREHIDMAKSFWLSFQRYLPWVLLLYILLALLTTLIFFSQLTVFSRAADLFNSAKGALTYAELFFQFAFVRWSIIIGTVATVLIWMWVAYFGYMLTILIIDGFYQLFAKESPFFIARRTRYLRFLRKKLKKYLHGALFIIILTALWLMIRMKFFELNPEEMVDFFIIVIAFIIPVVYVLVWGRLLFIRRWKKQRAKFDVYLFSKWAIHKRFKTILDYCAFFTVFGWILLPSLFMSWVWLENAGTTFLLNSCDYKTKWNLIAGDLHSSIPAVSNSIGGVPNPDELKKSLTSLRDERRGLRNAFPRFQRGMFFIITFAALFEIGIPSVASATIYGDRRKALRGVFIATFKTTVLVGVLQLLIKKAFFVDISDVMGISTIFFFTVSFFLMQQSLQPAIDKQKTEPET